MSLSSATHGVRQTAGDRQPRRQDPRYLDICIPGQSPFAQTQPCRASESTAIRVIGLVYVNLPVVTHARNRVEPRLYVTVVLQADPWLLPLGMDDLKAPV